MKLNRTEGLLLGIIVLSWASLPLILHFSGSGAAGEHTGTVMAVGLLVGAALALAVVMRAARRLASVGNAMLGSLGFVPQPVGSAELGEWVPPEFRGLPAKIDDFAIPGHGPDVRNIWRRSTATGIRWVYPLRIQVNPGGRGAWALTVMCVEIPDRSWPTFWLRPKGIFPPRLTSDAPDPICWGRGSAFERHWEAVGQHPEQIIALLRDEVRRALGTPKALRFAIHGNRLFLYTPDAMLLPDTCADWIAEMEGRADRIIPTLPSGA